MNVSFSELTEALRSVDLEPQSYSGRGMYGRQCVSVQGPSQKDMISRIVMCGLAPEQVGHLIQMSHSDSMGLGVVVYWPSIEWIEPKSFHVNGVDPDDGSVTLLFEADNSSEAREWMNRYVQSENAGGWSRIEIHDMRGECAENLWVWEKNDD